MGESCSGSDRVGEEEGEEKREGKGGREGRKGTSSKLGVKESFLCFLPKTFNIETL